MPQYGDTDFLRERAAEILAFYYPTCVDDRHGGFVAQLDEETGAVYDADAKHVVATARFTANFAVGYRVGVGEWCKDQCRRGVEILVRHHRDDDRGGFHRLLDGVDPVDSRRFCYDHAFALLAFARAADCDVSGATAALETAYDEFVERFWEADHDCCRSEWNADWTRSSPYRGQNANMHACEALLAAREATGERRFLDRAYDVADAVCRRLTAETDGLLWEHYTSDWEHDFAYNRDDREHRFRPWGYQPGHHAEWAKLLATMTRYRDDRWLRVRAEELFEAAVVYGWDDEHGGFFYTFDREGDPIVTDTYGWTVAEGIGAAAALYRLTDSETYREWHDRFWAYADDHLVASGGNWYERVSRQNERYEPPRGPAVEPGYHPVGACFDAIRSSEEC